MNLPRRVIAGTSDVDQNRDKPQSGRADLSSPNLFRCAGVAALIIVMFTVIQATVFITNPQPGTAEGWFTLLQSNKLVGLVDMDILLVVDNILAIPIFLAFYFTLKQSAKSSTLLAVILGMAGIITYFASNTSLQMLTLSNQYALATTDTQRSMLLASGQSMLAIYEGTAFYVGSFIGIVALLIVSIVMVRNNVFSKTTAYVGIIANVLGFGLFIPNVIGIILSIISVLFLAVWWIMIARKLFQLRQPGEKYSSPVIAEGGA